LELAGGVSDRYINMLPIQSHDKALAIASGGRVRHRHRFFCTDDGSIKVIIMMNYAIK
jgi:hypothetical protein